MSRGNRNFSENAWWLRQAVLMAILAMLLLLIFEQTALDLRVERFFYDASSGDFPLRRHWFFELVMHHGLKQVSYTLLLPAAIVCLLAMRGKFAWLPPRNALLALVGMLLIPATTALLKQFTNRHCPWDIIDFGGFAPYIGLLVPGPQDIARGMCFPAGHASGGFAWMVWALALTHSMKPLARTILALSLTVGLAMGLARMAQGAHFLSHTLWSAWWAWTLSLLLAWLFRAEIFAGQTELKQAWCEQESPDGQCVR
jgi:membrane-associated PAP2 superfamily phosphatase